MAKIEANMKVSVEKVVHNEIMKVLQYISDEHHICITDITASWIDLSAHDNKKFMLTDIVMTTKSKPE